MQATSSCSPLSPHFALSNDQGTETLHGLGSGKPLIKTKPNWAYQPRCWASVPEVLQVTLHDSTHAGLTKR